MQKIKELLSYPSTWKGIVMGLTIIGVKLDPAQADMIATMGTTLIAFIWTFFSDTDVKKP